MTKPFSSSRRAWWATLNLLFVLAEWSALTPSGLLGQDSARQRPFRVDLEALYLTAARVWPVSNRWSIGPEVGVGVHEQKTFTPSGQDFTSGAHLGVVVSLGGHDRSLDLAARFGGGDLLESGDVPEVYAGLVTTAALGSDRFQLGTRVTAASMWTSGQGSHAVLAWSPILLRVRF